MNVHLYGISKNASDLELLEAIKHVFLQSTDNLSWLKSGDLVLLKPALNSADPYPATYHPLAVKVVRDVLEERGAKVIVGDQSGIEHVLQDSEKIIRGNSKKCFEKSGMSMGLNYDFKAFEQEGWEQGFSHFPQKKASSWPNGFYYTKWVDKADHIINLPRLSTHGMAGVTLGFKNWVGILREDSRLAFHANGPYVWFSKIFSRGTNLEKNDQSGKFFEKITEVSLAVKDKLRCTLFVGTEAQVTMGPDKYILRFGKKGLLPACRVKPEAGLIFASQDPVAAEAVAIALMTILYQEAPFYQKLMQKLLVGLNGQIKELGQEPVWNNQFIKHALGLGLGKRNVNIEYNQVPIKLQNQLTNLIQ